MAPANAPCSNNTAQSQRSSDIGNKYHNFAMLVWRFETLILPNGRNDVQSEIDGYDDYAREAFSRAVSQDRKSVV